MKNENNNIEEIKAKSVEEVAEAVAAAEKAAADKKRVSSFNKRNFKHGTLSVILTLVFVAVIVVFNVIVGMISERFDTEADLTAMGIYTLSEETEAFIRNVDKKVTITVLNSESGFEAMGDLYKQVNEILKKMHIANPLITIDYKVLDQNPAYASKFTGEDIAANYIVVEGEKAGQYKIIVDDLQQSLYYALYYGTSTGKGYLTVDAQAYQNAYYAAYYSGTGVDMYDYIYSNIEQKVISALMFVTNSDPVRVAFTEGYDETDSTALQSLLSDNGYIVETINLTQIETVDPDIDFVVMLAPKIDVDAKNITKLDKFLDNNGAFGKNVLYFASTSQPETPNIEAFLGDWGLSVGYSAVGQSDTNYIYSLGGQINPYYHLQNICDTPYAGSTYGNGLYTYGANMRPVIQLWEGGAKGNVEQQVLMQTYDNAFLSPLVKPEEDFNIETAESGVFNDVVMAYRVHSTTQSVSRLTVFGSADFANSSFFSFGNANNGKFIVNMFNYICGKDGAVTITPRSFATSGFDMTAQHADTLAVVLCIVIPVVVIALGIVIWVRRRHR